MLFEKKEIVDALNWSCFSGEKVAKEISEKDIYITTKGWLFVNMSATKSPQRYSGIDVYKYPLNDYCECYTSLWNLYNKPFKNYVNKAINTENLTQREIEWRIKYNEDFKYQRTLRPADRPKALAKFMKENPKPD